MSKAIKLLLLDDEATLGLIVKESLEIRGFAVRYCEDGEAGWKAFQEHRPDVCILDVFITKLRKYLRPDPRVEIVNVRGVGYKLIC